MIPLLFAGKYGNSVSSDRGGGSCDGLYLPNDSHLISNSSYSTKLASKLKLRYSTFGRWEGMICKLVI